MIRLAILSVPIVFLFGNCQKENKDAKVIYEIRETSNDVPNYNITYTADKSGTSSTINSSSDQWTSASLVLSKGQFVSLTLDCAAPHFDFTIDIFVDGALWKETQMSNPTSSTALSGNIGN